MRFCSDHWQALRKAVADQGLSGLVSNDGTVAASVFAHALSGEDSLATFDPLMYAHFDIISHATEMSGGAVLAEPGCPICACADWHEKTCIGPERGCRLTRADFNGWVDIAAEHAKEHYDELSAKPARLS